MGGTAASAVQAALERLNDVHARTSCVADRCDDATLRAAATAPPGALHGEPITVKDWIDVSGFRCSGGSSAYEHRRPERDATAVARLRAAGAVVIAKTSVLVDSEHYGVVRHPHDPALSPGGSSSGEAAAVGGGGVRLGIGSDSGGSVRVPAAWCRVVGMKPSAGLIPGSGHFPRIGARSDGRTVLGPLSATVEMAWRAVQVMAGPDDEDGGVSPVPLGDPAAIDVASLRIAVGVPGGMPVSSQVTDALGHARAIVFAAGASDAGAPPDWTDEALRITESHWNRAHGSGEQVDAELWDWDRFRRRVLQHLRDVDVLITPTTAGIAPPHRAMRTSDYLFCLPASLTGQPAISVPVDDAAVQVIARRWDDSVAVAVAQLLEDAQTAAAP